MIHFGRLSRTFTKWNNYITELDSSNKTKCNQVPKSCYQKHNYNCVQSKHFSQPSIKLLRNIIIKIQKILMWRAMYYGYPRTNSWHGWLHPVITIMTTVKELGVITIKYLILNLTMQNITKQLTLILNYLVKNTRKPYWGNQQYLPYICQLLSWSSLQRNSIILFSSKIIASDCLIQRLHFLHISSVTYDWYKAPYTPHCHSTHLHSRLISIKLYLTYI